MRRTTTTSTRKNTFPSINHTTEKETPAGWRNRDRYKEVHTHIIASYYTSSAFSLLLYLHRQTDREDTGSIALPEEVRLFCTANTDVQIIQRPSHWKHCRIQQCPNDKISVQQKQIFSLQNVFVVGIIRKEVEDYKEKIFLAIFSLHWCRSYLIPFICDILINLF